MTEVDNFLEYFLSVDKMFLPDYFYVILDYKVMHSSKHSLTADKLRVCIKVEHELEKL